MMLRATCLSLVFAAVLPAQADELLVLQRGQDRHARDLLYSELHAVLADVDLEDATLAELAEYLTAASGEITNFAVFTEADFEPLTLQLERTRLTTVMDIAQRFAKIRFVFRNGVVVIKGRDEVVEYTSLRRYDIRAATVTIPSRPGPDLRLRTPGDEDSVADDEAEEVTTSGFTADKLVDLIRTQVRPESWDENGTSVTQLHGVLWVRQTDSGHRRVEELLRALGVIVAPRVVVRRRAAPRTAK